ncbi:uncharacterized protein LOC125676703 [Ostrea edulis]|uniref:uncharacterized protein LOC125676703 n=1 Tax=Ostrea edulis TaxID=37623 RepID=UPI0020959F9C|nr:uncharacterized protein LOC125676703 [Ostrea edulis]
MIHYACLQVVSSAYAKCYTWDVFQDGQLLGRKMRRLDKVGPFMCIRECLLRRSCKSINYYQLLSLCDINYDTISSNHSLQQLGGTWRYLDKRQMYSMLDVSPCSDTTCGENERCEVLANKSVVCSVTECGPLAAEKLRLVDSSYSPLMVGSRVRYQCVNNPSLLVLHQCQQTGTWKALQRIPKECIKDKSPE